MTLISLMAGGHLIEDGSLAAGWTLAGVGFIGVVMLVRKGALEARAYADAWRERPRQTDKQFLMDCAVSETGDAAGIALAVRAAMAEVAGVPAETIYANDSMRDRIWDSIDMLDVEFRIEELARVKVMHRWLDSACEAAGGMNNVRVHHVVAGVARNVMPTPTEDASGQEKTVLTR